MVKASENGHYFRITPDDRDLNYQKYFTVGEKMVDESIDYNSHNTRRLSNEELKEILLDLPYVQEKLVEWEERK